MESPKIVDIANPRQGKKAILQGVGLLFAGFILLVIFASSAASGASTFGVFGVVVGAGVVIYGLIKIAGGKFKHWYNWK